MLALVASPLRSRNVSSGSNSHRPASSYSSSSSTAFFLLFGLVSLISNLSVAEAHPTSRPRATVCNGYAEFCSRSYGNVTYVGAHDSYAVGSSVAANQDYDATHQLNDGIRLLQVQAHNTSSGIHLCHTSCSLLDGGSFQSYLAPVKTWLDANPNEVLSILIVNSDDLPPTAYASIYQAVGLDKLSYAPPSSSIGSEAWPNLGDMIDQGKRLVTFMDFKADFTQVPYLIDEFTNVWETAFDVTDQTFDCNVNRTGSAGDKMYLINHFLDENETILGQTFPVPDKSKLTQTNGVSGTGSLGLQAQQCGAQYGKYPNYLLVDFYDYGDGSVFQVAATLNGVSVNPATQTISPPASGSGGPTQTGSQPNESFKPNSARMSARMAPLGFSFFGRSGNEASLGGGAAMMLLSAFVSVGFALVWA